MKDWKTEIGSIVMDGSKDGYFAGQLLVATPQIQESCFAKAVIYICAHNEGGAMGIIINQEVTNINSMELIRQLGISIFDEDFPTERFNFPIYFGGPVDPGRGFILHGNDYKTDDSLIINENFSLSANIKVFQDVVLDAGPKEKLFVLGYAGWGENQLEREIEANGWFTAPATKELVFGAESPNAKWLLACCSIGVDPYKFSGDAGHA